MKKILHAAVVLCFAALLAPSFPAFAQEEDEAPPAPPPGPPPQAAQFDRFLAAFSNPSMGAGQRSMAAIQIRGLLLADRKTGALGEDVWGRFGEALLAPGTPEGLRDNALENFRHFPNREGCAQAGRNLLGAKDASARRIGALLAMTAFFRSTSDEESRRLFDAFAAEPALAEAAAAARNFPQLLRRIPDDALAPKAAAFLDMARPMPAAQIWS